MGIHEHSTESYRIRIGADLDDSLEREAVDTFVTPDGLVIEVGMDARGLRHRRRADRRVGGRGDGRARLPLRPVRAGGRLIMSLPDRPEVWVHDEFPSDDEVRTFYEIPDGVARTEGGEREWLIT